MRPLVLATLTAVFGLLLVSDTTPARADVTTKQRRELQGIGRDLAKIRTMIRKKEFDEAAKVVDEATTRVRAIMKDAEVDESNRYVATALKLIRTQKGLIARAQPVSFEEKVAPILTSKCLRCHDSDRKQGGLDLSTFAGLKSGGSSRRPLVAAGSAARSMLMSRLTTTNDRMRMPRGGAKLDDDELATIAYWIEQGAKFDGKKPTDPIGKSGEAVRTIEVAEATGDEKVSFVNDIAPWFSNLCLRCHNGARGRSGFSVATFEDIMKGGDSGRVVLAGNLEGSRLFRLVGGLENPRMPNDNQSRITRKNYEDLKTWILEGAKFDGDDPKKAIRDLVPSTAEKKAMEFAKLTPDEFEAYREKRTEELWDRALPKERPAWATADEVYVYGGVAEARQKEVAEWAEEHATALRKVFGIRGDDTIWKGKLAVFVTKDRFAFDEFVTVILDRRAPREMTGLSVVTTDGEDAYVLLQDTGADDTGSTAPLKINLIDHMTGAFLKRGGGRLPDWLVRGTGLAVAASVNEEDAYISGLRSDVPKLVGALGRPEEVFADGSFSPGTVGPVGFALVEFLIENGGGPKFGRFVAALQSGKDQAAAMKDVYRTDLRSVATAFAAGLSKKRR